MENFITKRLRFFVFWLVLIDAALILSAGVFVQAHAEIPPIFPCECDFNEDLDVDGADVAEFINNSAGYTLSDLAVNFGRTDCPGYIPAGFASDDFNHNNLNTSLWNLVNPLADATVMLVGAGSGDAQVLLTVPAGLSHDAWSVNESARLMQPAADTDFEIEVKFDSLVLERYQDQGVIVEESAGNWLRFDVYSDGSRTLIFAASVVNGSPSVKISKVITTASPIYLNVERTGNTWNLSYSYDGASWTLAGSFTHVLAVTAVGPYAGNYDVGSNAPAHTAVIDYFFNMASPIEPEDNGVVVDERPPLLQQIEYDTATTSIEVTWVTDEQSSSYVEYGKTPSLELEPLGQNDKVWSHTVVVDNLLTNTPYYLRVVSEDWSGNRSVSQVEEISTGSDEGGPTIDVWYGSDQSFGNLGNPQQWVNILGNVSDPDGVGPLVYSLNGDPSNALTIGPDSRRLAAQGDFNVELDINSLTNGINTIELTAEDDNGNITTEIVTVNYAAGNYWPENYSINWDTVSEIQQVAQVVDGLWSISSNGVYPVQLGYDRLIAIGDMAWSDYEVTVPITVHSIDPSGYNPPSNGPAVGIGLRWTGHTAWDSAQPRWGFWPTGAFAWYRWKSTFERFQLAGNEYQQIAEDFSGRKLSLGVTYVFKARVETLPAGNARYSFKVWEQGEAVPSNWDLTIEEGLEDPQYGSMLLLAHHVFATFGNVQIVPLGLQTANLKTALKSYSVEPSLNLTEENLSLGIEPDNETITQVPAFARER